MKAALVITGNEMLSGFRRDALVQPFCAMLGAAGAMVGEVRFIGDDPLVLEKSLSDLAGHDLIVVTGGLGLTPDDTTHRVIEKIASCAEVAAEIENPVGFAKGRDFKTADSRIIFLPGVPGESLVMLENFSRTLGTDSRRKVQLTVFGLRETEIAERLGDIAADCSFLPRDGEITLFVPQSGLEAVRKILGRHVLEEESLSRSLGRLLEQRALSVCSAESCTGGMTGQLLSADAGSSNYYCGSVVSYSNAVKTGVLGVAQAVLDEHGAVSAETAREMLAGALRLTGADCGMAVTGIAGPAGGTPEKPVGTVWIAVGSTADIRTQKFKFRFDRSGNRMIAAKAALFMLREYIYAEDLYSPAAAG